MSGQTVPMACVFGLLLSALVPCPTSGEVTPLSATALPAAERTMVTAAPRRFTKPRTCRIPASSAPFPWVLSYVNTWPLS